MPNNIHIYPSTFTNESRILREAKTISRMGVFDKIYLVGVHESNLLDYEVLSDDISINRLAPSKGGRGSINKIIKMFAWCFNVFFFSIRKDIKCVNCHSLTVLPLCYFISLVTRSKLVYDAHELETEVGYSEGIRKRLSKFVERSLIYRADHSIFVGNAINRWYRNTYGITNTSVVLNCPEPPEDQAITSLRDIFKVNEAKRIFLYQGVLSEGRGITNIIEAFKTHKIDQAVVIFMGYGPLEAHIRDNCQDGLLYFHEAVNPSELLSYTRSADFGLSIIEPVSKSYQYCMPNKLFEYVFAGIPLVVSPMLEQKEFVESSEIGVVTQDCSVEAIVSGIKDIMAHDYDKLTEHVKLCQKGVNWNGQEEVLRQVFIQELGFVPFESQEK